MICPRCGNSNVDDARFCKVCGEPLSSSAPAPDSQTPVYSQPVYGQQVYGAGYDDNPPRKGDPKKNGFAIFGFVASLVTLPCCFSYMAFLISDAAYYIIAILGLLIQIAAIACSIRGVGSAHKGLAIAGIVIGAIGFLMAAFMLVMMLLAISSGGLNSEEFQDLYRQLMEQMESQQGG